MAFKLIVIGPSLGLTGIGQDGAQGLAKIKA